MRATLLDGSRLALGLVAGVTLCLVGFGDQIVRLWMGPGFGDSIAPLNVLVLAGVVVVGQGPAGTILLAAGRHRLVAVASILDIVLNIGLSVALVSRYGLTGVALGTALPYAVLNVALLVPVACWTLQVPLRRFASIVITPSVVALFPAAVAAVVIRSALSPTSFVMALAECAFVGIVYVAGFCGLGLRPADRARYVGAVRRSPTGVAPRIAHSQL
jgi:O-antigen/teichoic acid export membrane protein